MTQEKEAGPDRRTWLALVVLMLPCVVVVMDLTVLFLAVPAITRDLAPSATQLLWITDVYGFVVAASLITQRGLPDRRPGAAGLRRGDPRALGDGAGLRPVPAR